MNKTYLGQFLKKWVSRLTLFDWISLILVAGLVVVVAAYFLRHWEWVQVEVKVAPSDFFWSEKKPPAWLANSLQLGDSELDGLGRKVAEITDLRIFEGPGERKITYLKLRLRVVKDSRKQQYLFKSKQLAIGSPVEFRFPRVFLNGLVTYIEGIPDTRIWEEKIMEVRVTQWIEVFPETLGMFPWRVEAIKVGDQMKDTQGRVVAEILEKRVKPAEKIVVTSDGRVLLRQDPIKKDVTLVIKLQTVKQAGVNYFLDEFKVKVGTSILLALPEIDIWPEITRIIQ